MTATLQRAPASIPDGVMDGLKLVLPAAVAVVPFATMIGVALGDSQVSNTAGFVGGLFVAGGSAHLAAIGSMGVGTGIATTLLTALLINARGLVYGAALAPAFRSQPHWFRWLAAYGLVDQMFALANEVAGRSDRYVRRFYLSAMTLLWIGYFGGVALGLTVGPVIPASVPLGIGIPVMFLAMLAPGLETRPSYGAAVTALVVAVAASGLPSGLGLIAAIAAGTTAGVVLERSRDE